MTIKGRILVCVVGIVLNCNLAYGQQSPPCTGVAAGKRPSCVRAGAANKNTADAEEHAKLTRLENAMTASCNRAAALDKAAKAAGRAGGITKAAPVTVSGVTWRTTHDLAYDLAKESAYCDDARAAVAQAKKKDGRGSGRSTPNPSFPHN